MACLSALVYAIFKAFTGRFRRVGVPLEKESEMGIMDMKVGDKAEITGYTVTQAGYRAKLLALGLTRGAEIQLVGVAPLGDPMRLRVRGFELSLRKSEATALQLRVAQ